MGQLESTFNELKAQGSSKLLSQIILNVRENCSAIMLRSGKKLRTKIQDPSTSSSKVEEYYATSNDSKKENSNKP